MEKVKISTLSKDTIVLVDGETSVKTIEEILEDKEGYRVKEIYTTIPYTACLDAKYILENAIENEECNSMYEEWGEQIWGDISNEDIAEIQAVLDRILSRCPSQNIAYNHDKLIEIDI